MNKIKRLLSDISIKLKSFVSRESLFEVLRTLVAILIAIIVVIIIIFFVSETPMNTIKVFFLYPFTDEYSRSEIISRATPLIFSGLAAAFMLRAKQFNLFGEGAFFIGGLVGAIVAIYFHLPIILLPLVAILISGLTGGIIGSVPAILKSKWKVNEFVVSLMMNFIVMWIGIFFLANVFNDPTAGDITTQIIPEAGRIPFIGEMSLVSLGIFLALLMTIFSHLFFYHTRFGYKMKMTGDNLDFASYSGIKTSRPIFYSQVIGAGIASVGGATEVLSNYTRFNWKSLPGYGFDGFMIAIIAKNKPLGILLVSLFFGYIRTGANQMAIFTDVSSEIVVILQSVVILLVAAQAFLQSYRKKFMAVKIKQLQNMDIKVVK